MNEYNGYVEIFPFFSFCIKVKEKRGGIFPKTRKKEGIKKMKKFASRNEGYFMVTLGILTGWILPSAWLKIEFLVWIGEAAIGYSALLLLFSELGYYYGRSPKSPVVTNDNIIYAGSCMLLGCIGLGFVIGCLKWAANKMSMEPKLIHGSEFLLGSWHLGAGPMLIGMLSGFVLPLATAGPLLAYLSGVDKREETRAVSSNSEPSSG